MKLFPAIVFAVFLLASGIAYAHPGGTDADGCHTCHTNCTRWGLDYEEYHCH